MNIINQQKKIVFTINKTNLEIDNHIYLRLNVFIL